jgi:ABC-2 type transport system permease protein
MRIVLIMAWKDFKQIVTSPLFFLISALCSVIWSITYLGFLRQFASQGMMAGLQNSQAPNIIRGVFTPHVSVTNLIFIVTLPALTMRLISEEKKSRSYDLLLTSPITATQIVVGKYLAGLGATMTLLAISLLYPVATATIADFSWQMLFSVYLGMFLMAALYTASGLFASSLTESAMLSVFMGVIFNFLIWFIGPSTSGIEIKWIADVMEYLSVGQHMMNFVNGLVQTSSLVFFVSVIGFFIFLSQRVVESSRWR